MPFGLGKSEKHMEDEEMAPKKAAEGSEVAPTTRSDNGREGAPPVTAGPHATKDQAKRDNVFRPPELRPDYIDEDASRESAAATKLARKPPVGATFFVSVTKGDGIETHRFEDPIEVQTFVEQLLEDGVPQEEVTAFSGHKLALAVSHRPIVKLVASKGD